MQHIRIYIYIYNDMKNNNLALYLDDNIIQSAFMEQLLVLIHNKVW